jgi:hypothetical protein
MNQTQVLYAYLLGLGLGITIAGLSASVGIPSEILLSGGAVFLFVLTVVNNVIKSL